MLSWFRAAIASRLRVGGERQPSGKECRPAMDGPRPCERQLLVTVKRMEEATQVRWVVLEDATGYRFAVSEDYADRRPDCKRVGP